jgi:hypothetical protein
MGDTLVTTSHLRLASFLTSNICTLPLRAVRYYAKHPDQIKAALQRGFVFPPPGAFQDLAGKFTLLADLGRLIIPENYQHKTALSSFKKCFKDRKWSDFEDFGDGVSDANFSNPSTVFVPGECYYVKAFLMKSGTTSDECLAFLAQNNAVFTGVQGLALVFREMGDRLPAEHSYLSFDIEERSLITQNGTCYLADLGINWKREHFVHLAQFDSMWGASSVLLCFWDRNP